jgi:hypothetical protein
VGLVSVAGCGVCWVLYVYVKGWWVCRGIYCDCRILRWKRNMLSGWPQQFCQRVNRARRSLRWIFRWPIVVLTRRHCIRFHRHILYGSGRRHVKHNPLPALEEMKNDAEAQMYSSLGFVVFFLMVVPGMVMNFKFPAWIANLSGIGSIFVFILWALVFSCPRCGTPYLWEIRGHRRIGRFFPRRTCTVCGQPTDKPYVK